MSEMLKRVGAAILEAETRWTPKSDEPKERALARAALEAMRDPTTPMLLDGATAWADAFGRSEPINQTVARTYGAMVESAISSKA